MQAKKIRLTTPGLTLVLHKLFGWFTWRIEGTLFFHSIARFE